MFQDPVAEIRGFQRMSEETTDTGTLQAGERKLRSAALATFAICAALDVYLLSVSASRLSLVPWLLLAITSIVMVGLNIRCLVTSGPTMGMIPVALTSLTPACLAGSNAFTRFSGPWWTCIVVSALTFLICAYMVCWFRRLESVYQKPADPDEDAVLVVLGGPVRNGEPTLTVQNRLAVAASLWREAPQRLIVTTGGPDTTGTTNEAESMRTWLVHHEGVPEDVILVEPRALNTTQNIAYSLKMLSEAGLSNRQVCVVTSDYHLYRALTIARRQDPTIIGMPASVPSESAIQQWCREVIVILTTGLA